jgi:hypothetical protein
MDKTKLFARRIAPSSQKVSIAGELGPFSRNQLLATVSMEKFPKKHNNSCTSISIKYIKLIKLFFYIISSFKEHLCLLPFGNQPWFASPFLCNNLL